MIRIDICDEASLLEAFGLLRDARFAHNASRFDESAGRWRGVFARDFLEDPGLIVEEPGWTWTKVTFPLSECVLELVGVRNVAVRAGSRIGTYTLGECTPTVKHNYLLDFHEDMDILVTFEDGPAGRLQDTRLLDQHGVFFRAARAKLAPREPAEG